ncbi:6-phosphofructokinase [Ectobacillus ponti]|uniref:ATP-dependent 6-phosphofructokinase n=1 Tax=Ectobacillus ponti TaxID=2961894 RepID=A0AA41X9I1_9BACI|nr:6-phosphofructokinase [Ectobacillus ponti]MCP8969365.1 6-phosphofructokinase [Ectobacillus ponti]
MSRLGILTSGGDAPGMNAAIRAAVKAANHHGLDVTGIQRGYQGLMEGDVRQLQFADVADFADKGGTILKTSRSLEFMEEAGRSKALRTLERLEINRLVVIGGEGSFKGAEKLHESGIQVIGIPGTIDNDLAYTDYSIGFDTTLNTVLECIGRIKDTDSSHDKTTIIEVMGRYCGDVALYSALAGGGEIISTPEQKLGFAEICSQLQERIVAGKHDNLIIVTERMYSLPELQQYIEEELHVSVRTTVLGFIQRGGNPSAFDRVLAGRMGVKAVELLLEGVSGQAVGMKENKLIHKAFRDIHAETADKQEQYQLLATLL